MVKQITRAYALEYMNKHYAYAAVSKSPPWKIKRYIGILEQIWIFVNLMWALFYELILKTLPGPTRNPQDLK